VFVAASSGDARTDRTQLTGEDRQLFEWFDRLGIEDIKSARLVRIRTGSVKLASEKGGPFERQPDEPRGFLLWEKNDEARILLGDLTVATFARKGKEPHENDYVGWRIVSMESEVSVLLRALSKKELDGFWDDRHEVYFDRLNMEGQAFVLARFCAAHQREDLAARLLAVVRKRAAAETSSGLAAYLRTKFRGLFHWRASMAMADATQDRRSLAGLYRTMANESDWEKATEWAATLESMAKEDATHRAFTPEEFERLPPADQVAELVFQLRDDNTVASDLWPRPWPAPPSQGNHAVEKLTQLGTAAVPALIKALEDERPTRSVYRNNRYGGGAEVRQIRELAAKALEGIVGVNLFWMIPDSGMLPFEERWQKLRAIAADWGRAAEAKSEVEWFRARIVSGSAEAGYCLDVLAKRFPDEFLPVALASLSQVQDLRVRSEMIKRLWKHDTPEVQAFLLREVSNGPALGNRVAAAYPLRKSHRDTVISAMLREWQDFVKSVSGPPPKKGQRRKIEWNPGPSPDPNSLQPLLQFLVELDSSEAVRAVQKAWPFFDTRFRDFVMREYHLRLVSEFSETVEPAGKDTRDAIERLLIEALKDDHELKGTFSGSVQAPRLAELAADYLARHWPSKYQFELQASRKKRAAQLAIVRRAADR
jgi:hypothetical protein